MYKSKESGGPGTSYMSEDQMGQYLKDLRTQRTSRPSGSRPPPPSKFASFRRPETVATEQQTKSERPSLLTSTSMPIIPAQHLSQRAVEPQVRARSPFAGRPLARPPSTAPEETIAPLEPSKRPVSGVYVEAGSRWMEKQEAKSLRMALEDMDLGAEQRVHAAAQDEAAELVWKHQNPDSPFANPEAPYANPEAQPSPSARKTSGAQQPVEGLKNYRSHLRKGSYQRTHSREQVPTVQSRKSSSGSQRPSLDVRKFGKRTTSTDVSRKASPPAATMSVRKTRTPSGKSYGGLAEAVASDIAKAQRRISSGSGSKRIMSGEKKAFMHKSDRIWEDPQEEATPSKSMPLPPIEEPTQLVLRKPAVTPVQPAGHIRKNPFARVRMQQDGLVHSNSAPVLPVTKHHSVEIQRNTPTQSRRPWYMSNEALPPTPPPSSELPADEVSPKLTPTRDSVEIRGDDIRAATSKQRKDRSPKLPLPTLVSDKPGRPIVSFQHQVKEVVLEEVHAAPSTESLRTNKALDFARAASPTPRFPLPRAASPLPNPHASRPVSPMPKLDPPSTNVPRASVTFGSRPPLPTIVTPDDEPTIPTIVLPEEPNFAEPSCSSAPVTPGFGVSAPIFSITVADTASRPSTNPSPRRPLPIPSRPLPHHSATAPVPTLKSRPHYSPSILRQTGIALCAHCALPIAGRILSAAGQRFHPTCFICHECGTNLECVAFYPEPERQRTERVARIEARHMGAEPDIPDGITLEQLHDLESTDGEPSLRFYCHLDFHELFSPRCKSCKTPIEGEIIVACGAEWHAGHFFCAQCGDPFSSTTPFVEKDGYAWCVGCHTHRYSSKCRKCRKPVTEVVVKALGADWHEKCFACVECNGDFGDGRYFLRGESQEPVCVKCEERRLKA